MSQEPLAFRMRPKKIEDIVGQQHLIGKGKIIERMVRTKMLSSMILYGPPGVGKTSIASAISGSTKYAFRMLNAATDSKKDLQIVVEEAKISGTVILLLDEIHRLDKTKQDFLLPYLERGQIILIGATTENPYISINPAVRSRIQIFEVKSLTNSDMMNAIERAISDKINGLGKYNIKIDSISKRYLIQATNGDLRSALNGLELAVKSTDPNDDGVIDINLSIIKESIQKKVLLADKNGDAHYNIISALQKSIRGSDVDAALHYAARLFEAGDLLILSRRLRVIAYEDIGLANPIVVERAIIAIETAEKLGFPEARIPLANAIIELSLSPKSNSAIKAIDAALDDVNSGDVGEIPVYLKDAHYAEAEKLGHGVNYLYPHNYPNDWIAQQYLPERLKNKNYWQPKGNSKIEIAYKQQYHKIRQAQKRDLK